MGLSLREMQELAEAEFTVADTRKDLNRLVEYFMAREDQVESVEVAFVKERQLSWDIAREHKIFFVDDELEKIDLPEEFCEESFGFVRGSHLVFSGRLVYPVMDVKGDVMGFCGWDKFEKPKYLDSKTYGYTAKQTTFYGMEKLPEYYRSGKPIYVVEGIVCCLYLRSIGLQAIATLGSSISGYVLEILKRVENRLIFIPDNDVIGKNNEELATSLAGEHYVRQVKRLLPRATVIQSIVAKDIDDTRKVEDHKYEGLLKEDLLKVAQCPYLKFNVIRVR